MRNIYVYVGDTLKKGTVEQFMKNLNPKIKKKYEFILRLIADENTQLKEPYVKHFAIERYRELYELRLKAAKTMVRIIFYKVENNIILLYAFMKRDKKDTEQALECALKMIQSIDNKALNPFENLKEVEIH